MIVRLFDGETDSFDTLASMNDWPPQMQAWLARALEARYMPGSHLVALEGDDIVGTVLLLDAGAYLAAEGAYLLPEHRTYANAHVLLRAIDAEARRRGVPMVVTHAPERIGNGLVHYGYHASSGPYHLYVRAVPQEP